MKNLSWMRHTLLKAFISGTQYQVFYWIYDYIVESQRRIRSGDLLSSVCFIVALLLLDERKNSQDQ